MASIPILRLRLHNIRVPFNSLEAKEFSSLNSEVGWLGITALPFCANFPSRILQQSPSATVSIFMSQSSGLKALQKLPSAISFTRHHYKSNHKLAILVFSDGGRQCEECKLCNIAFLALYEMRSWSIYHVLSYSSQNTKLPVRSICAADILAAVKSIDEGKMLYHSISTLFSTEVQLYVALGLNYLFTSLYM